MQFLELDFQTRFEIYTHTKKVLRKYQKGIVSGKLTSAQFVDNMFKDKSMMNLLDSINAETEDFKKEYKNYVDTLIKIQNETLINNKKKSYSYYSKKADYSSIFKLNHILSTSGYKLSIPAQYLTEWDVDSIIKFVTTGVIELGNEKIFNYVCK